MSRIYLIVGENRHALNAIGTGASLSEDLNGELTMQFTVLPEDLPWLTEGLPLLTDSLDPILTDEGVTIETSSLTAAGTIATVEFEGQYFDITKVHLYGNALATFAEVTAEHVTYRLNRAEYDVETMSLGGTNAAVLARVLAETGFSAGDVPSGVLPERVIGDVTRRETLTTVAGLMGGELVYDGWTVSVVQHRGRTVPVDLMATGNVASVEVEEDLLSAERFYRIGLIRRGGLTLGDEVFISYQPFGLHTQSRIVAVKRNPYNDFDVTVEIGRHIPEITDRFIEQQEAVKKAQAAADNAQAKADTAQAKADAAKTKADNVESSLSNYVRTSEVSAKVDEYVNSDAGKASITASLSGTYQTIDGMSGYEKKTELSADIGAYIDTQAGTAKITAAVSGTYAEKSELTGYEKKTELSADIGAYIDTQAGTAKITAAVSGTYAEKSELTGYEKKTELSADIGAYIDTQAGTAKVVSACSGTYQTVAGMSGYVTTTGLNTSIGQYIDSTTGKAKVVSACSGTYQTVAGMSGYVTTTGLNTSIGQYIDSTTGKAKVVSACSGTYQTVAGMSGYVTTTGLNTSIGQYIDSTTGSAKVVSACSGTYQTQAGMSSYYTKAQVDTEISQSVSPIESAISLTASYGSGTIGSNVRALLQLVANADSSSINIKADKINFTGFTTFLKASDLGSGGSTSIDGGRILTGTISADRIDATNIKLRALYGSGTSYANVALLYSSGDDLYIGQSMSSSSTNVDMIKMRANTINIGRSDTSQLVIDNANKVIRHNYTANTANIDLGNSTHQFNNLYVKKIYLDGTELTGGGSDTLYVSGTTTNYIKLNSSKDFVASGTGFSLGSTSYPFDEFYCGSASYYLKHTSAGIIPNTTSTSASYFQLGSSSYPFNDLYVKNLHVSGSFDMAGSTVKMGGTSSYYLEANTSRELKPSSSSATYPAYLGTSSIYWHYAYIGSNIAIIGSSGTSNGSKLGFFGTTAVVRQTLSLTSNNMSYTSVTASNYLYALNNLIGILKKHGLIAT